MLFDSERLSDLFSRLNNDLLFFSPELILCGTIVLMLFSRLFPFGRQIHQSITGIFACAIGFMILVMHWSAFTATARGGVGFDGLVMFDPFSTYLRGLILLATLLVLILGRITGLPDREDSADFNVLLLGGTLGMMLMSSANHMLMIFIAIEMASLPSYVLTGFLKGRPYASEAALKYVIFGAASSGVMLFGISLLAGQFGTGNIHDLCLEMTRIFRDKGFDMPIVTGLVFFFLGLGFKLSAVPVHLWLPDAFQGGAAEVAAFLSVASKAAAVGLTARIVLMFQKQAQETGLLQTDLPKTIGLGLLIAAAVTATIGNLGALPQTNLKRLLGYSTIAHAGYLMMGLATMSRSGTSAILVYLTAYMFMNLGAFAIVAMIRNRTGSEEVSASAGLMTRSPGLGVAYAVFLFSLLGVPPLAGFAGKFLVFSAVYKGGEIYSAELPWLGTCFYVLLAVGVINTALSAGYYLRLMRVMSLDEPTNSAPLGEQLAGRVYVMVLALALLVLGIWWNPLIDMSRQAVIGM